MFFKQLPDLYKKFEKWISPIGLIYGFIFTSLTLTRVDAWLENFWIVVHLLIAAFGIGALTYFENKNWAAEEKDKFHFYLTLIIQFAFGGLFSTFFVFYLRSTSFSDSWFFVLLLLTLLVGNELWKKYYERLVFQISVLFISLYLFLIFLLPVLFSRLGADLFVLAGLASLLLIFLFTFVLKKFSREKFYHSHNFLKASIMGIFILLNVLYFTDVIPPIPLSLKESGVYHSIIKKSAGYEVKAEPSAWRDYFTRYPVFHKRAGEPVYVFSAIFSPVKFATETIHEWQYYDEAKKEWVSAGRVTLPITGGREEGFRTYSRRQAVSVGLWRVKVLTPSGQVLGSIKFRVENDTSTPAVTKITL